MSLSRYISKFGGLLNSSGLAPASALQPDAQYMGFKNRIINAGATVSQLGATNIVQNVWQYGGVDRFVIAPAGFSTYSGSTGPNPLAVTASGQAVWVAATTTGSGGNISIGQRIAAANVADLNSKTITISGKLYQETGGTLSVVVQLYKPNALDNYAGFTQVGPNTTISVPSGTPTPFIATITLGATDAANGLWPLISYQGVGALTNKGFGLGDFTLERGSSVTSFDFRDTDSELVRCLRYRQKGNSSQAATGISTELEVITALGVKVDMRANPTISLLSGVSFHRPGIAFYSASAVSGGPTATGAGYSVFTISAGAGLSTNGQMLGDYLLDAELK